MFADRIDAGERLAEALAASGVHHGATTLVLGIPRGGVVPAAVVAAGLGARLDVVVPHKLGAPRNPELAIGAVAVDGPPVLDRAALRALRVPPSYVEDEIRRQHAEIERRLLAYRGSRQGIDPSGATCIVVDDGMATGATAEAAVRALQSRGAARVVVAVPVSSIQAAERIRATGATVVALATPDPFVAVGQFYDAFEQVSDDEVVRLLGSSESGSG